jgi:hypothetical protein
VGNLTAQIDPANAGRIRFSRPVTLSEAISYLWSQPPMQRDALRADPIERSMLGRQHAFLIKKDDMDLLLSLQHGLGNEYLKRLKPIMSNAKVELPKWLPMHVRKVITEGRLRNGVQRFPGMAPWGDIVVWYDGRGSSPKIELYEEYPEDIDFYIGFTKGDNDQARLLHQVYTGYNRDMRDFVDEKGHSPEWARDEIRRINDEVFKLVIEGAMMMMSVGTGVSATGSAMQASAGKITAAAEKTGFASATTKEALEEIRLTETEYKAALKQVFPAKYLEPIARTVDEIGQRAAEKVSQNPAFIKAVQNGDWKMAGTLFHSAAKDAVREVPAGVLPAGWSISAEVTIQSGLGGSRLDVFLNGPAGEMVEFDWKTTGASALSTASRREMLKHAGQVVANLNGKLTTQQSRSWVDYVRPLLPTLFR